MNDELLNIAALMIPLHCPWGFCGGWAIDLFLGHATRQHQDIDIAVLRRDQQIIRSHLTARGWALQRVLDAKPVPWLADEIISLPSHEVWCYNSSFDPPKFEMLLNESDGTNFIFRRDASITMPLDRAILRSDCDPPVLAPEIVLLYKSKDAGAAKNTSDFENTLGHLDPAARGWLGDALRRSQSQHPWPRML